MPSSVLSANSDLQFLNSALHFVLGVDPSSQPSSAPLTADEFVKSFHDALFYSMVRVVLGPVWKLLPQSKYKKTCSTAHSFVDYHIGQANEEDGTTKGKSLIRALNSQTNDPTFIRSQVIQAMMAAQDTTSELLTNALFLLARHPKYWAQLRLEFVGKQESDLLAGTLLESKLTQNILHESEKHDYLHHHLALH